ncbi:MAG: RNA pseudouridine synthase [Opitutales bacterium]|nr:RNA pseudouridine synthase [Opitutales bacterium]
MIGDISPFGSKSPLIKPEQLRSWLIFEDEHLLVFNKPGWVVCHPSKNGPWSSLVGAVREAYNADKMHLIARLDRETSGLVLICRDKLRASALQQAFQNRNTQKTYIAFLEGELAEAQEVSRALTADDESDVHVKQQVATDGSGYKAQTTFIPLAHGGGYTLCEVHPHTGRKHQIRAHAQWMGHPIVADKIYGHDDSLYLEFAQSGLTERLLATLPMPRQALHAWKLHIHTEEIDLSFEAPLPEDMLLFMKEAMGLDEIPSRPLPAPQRRRRRRAENEE